jgi:signal transduction histidine kinase
MRYRGVDRRTPAPAVETLDASRMSLLVLALWCAAMALVPSLPSSAQSVLERTGAIAACFAILAGVAMLIRWRIDGRAQSWWLSLGYVVTGAPAFLTTHPGTAEGPLLLPAFAVALAFFVAAHRAPEVDSILSVRRAAMGFAAAIAVTLAGVAVTSVTPVVTRGAAAALGIGFAVFALVWLRSQQDKPWFVVPLLGLALCCTIFAFVADNKTGAAEAGPVLLLINGIAAATALNGLQSSATRHRAIALDAERERDLVNSLRDDLEARYAETLHEVRSTLLALEGGIQVYRPRQETPDATLTHSLIAELQRLRAIADPNQASVPADFPLADALQHLSALSRASGWPVHWNIDDNIVVRGRPADVAQIVQELLANARKYAPGGPVDVTAIVVAQFALVLVDDVGPGVRAENRERIFERGERPEHRESEEGTGLGLHIARRLARALGGELWVEQHPGGGARFVLALRRAGFTTGAAPFLERTAS